MDKVTSATEKAKATDKTLVDIARKNLALREKRIEDEIEKQRQLEIEREKKEREEREKRKKEEELRLQQEEADRQKMLMAEKEDTNKDDVHLAAKEVFSPFTMVMTRLTGVRFCPKDHSKARKRL